MRGLECLGRMLVETYLEKLPKGDGMTNVNVRLAKLASSK